MPLRPEGSIFVGGRRLERRLLGSTGIEVSRMCLGTLTVGSLQMNLPPERGADVFQAAYEAGVNFFDSAQIYGSYPHLGAFLKRVPREKVVIAAKSYDYTYEGMRKSVEQALYELGTSYIDIYLMHEQESRQTLKGHSEGFRYLSEAKQKGVIRAIGASTHACEVAEAVSEMNLIDVLHPMYNYRSLGLIDGTFDRMRAAVVRAHDAGKGIYAMKVLGGGLMIEEIARALPWAIADPSLDSIALGIANVRELEVDLKFFGGEQPKAEELAATFKNKAIIIEQWCTGCGSCEAACKQGAIAIIGGKAKVDKSKCVLCGYCGKACPDFHIRIV
jgi:aryl-alcohol dehydrogenase-like predicted oxidoreductase